MQRYFGLVFSMLVLAITPIALLWVDPAEYRYQENITLYALLFALPYPLFLLVAFLGYRINQTRILFTVILLAISYYLLTQQPLEWWPAVHNVRLAQALAFMLPLAIAIFSSFREGYIFSVHGLLMLLCLAAPLAAALWLSSLTPAFVGNILAAHPLIRSSAWYLPDLLWGPIILLAGVYFVKPDNIQLRFSAAVLIGLIPLLTALNQAAGAVGELPPEKMIVISSAYSTIGMLLLQAMYTIYWQKVYIDELTGIPNRRSFDEYLLRLGRKYTIAMADIDHFKSFNDVYGHAEGDNVLRFAAGFLAENSSGRVYRYGGEEFAIVFAGKDLDDVFWKMEAVRDKLSRKDFYIRMPEISRQHKSADDRGEDSFETRAVRITISIGIAQRNGSQKTPREILRSADQALYAAKDHGRNCTMRADRLSAPNRRAARD